MVKTFLPTQRFFDQLATMLAGLALQNLGAAVYRPRPVTPFAPGDEIVVFGKSHVTNQQLVMRPASIIDPMLNGIWPTRIDVDIQLLGAVPPAAQRMSGMGRLNALQLASAYVTYFEASAPEVRTKWGDDPKNWPMVWNFARVVRNALVHDGQIDIRNPAAPPVSWKTLTYELKDNGKEILFKDLAYVELISLMEETSALL